MTHRDELMDLTKQIEQRPLVARVPCLFCDDGHLELAVHAEVFYEHPSGTPIGIVPTCELHHDDRVLIEHGYSRCTDCRNLYVKLSDTRCAACSFEIDLGPWIDDRDDLWAKNLRAREVNGHTYRLCNSHRTNMRRENCSKDSEGCEIANMSSYDRAGFRRSLDWGAISIIPMPKPNIDKPKLRPHSPEELQRSIEKLVEVANLPEDQARAALEKMIPQPKKDPKI